MLRNILTFWVVLCCAVGFMAAGNVEMTRASEWDQTYGGANDEWGQCVQQTFDGGYIMVGTKNSGPAGGLDIYLVKTDSAGDTVWTKTFVRKGASIGANATIRCGITLGEWCLVGSGAVVARDVAPHAIMIGVPAKQAGWACLCAGVLKLRERDGRWVCPEDNCNREYEIKGQTVNLAHVPDHARAMVELD